MIYLYYRFSGIEHKQTWPEKGCFTIHQYSHISAGVQPDAHVHTAAKTS